VSRSILALAAAALVVLSAEMPSAQTATIKLASVVPEISIWANALRQMSTDVSRETGGRVTLTVFAGGSQGDESTVLRKMRLDALQAAALTGVGLGTIDASFNVFDVPFFLESYGELNAVTEAMTPTLAKRLDAKGFVLVNWGNGGWTQIFTKKPVTTVVELKKSKLWTSSGNDRMVQWFKANGFEPRAMAMTDIMTGLTTGMVEAVPTTPIAALGYQWYKQTPNMLDIGLAPVVGATIVTKKAWNAIAAADRQKILTLAAAVQKRLEDDVPKTEATAIAEMQRRGLAVTKASGPEWRKEVDGLAATMRGEMVPKDMFDLALKARDAYRKQHPAAQAAPAAK
jgi:TRAP-type C4-dicarboxylate transport system substrate-binding protein